MGAEVRRPRVAVTRAVEQADELAQRLEAMGCEPVVWPLIAVEALDAAPVDPSPYDWIVVTSPNGATELAHRLTATPRQLAAIGPGTAAALRARGYEPDLVPRESTQEGLLAELPEPAGRVLVAAAEGARRVIVEALGADFLPLYRTVELAPQDSPAFDVVLLARARSRRGRRSSRTRPRRPACGSQQSSRGQGDDVVRSSRGRPRHGHTGPNGLRPPRARKR